jgi:hypothetical protein
MINRWNGFAPGHEEENLATLVPNSHVEDRVHTGVETINSVGLWHHRQSTNWMEANV